jgi:glyoxylase-like metal-dependent hydrolase (beta-lactamase superfamily II)
MILDKLQTAGIRITSISEKLHVIQGNNRSRTPFANAFLILDRKHILLDTGCGHEILHTVCREAGLDLVLNSHSHLDHTAGNCIVPSGTEIMVPVEGKETISRAELMALRFVGEPLAGVWMATYPPLTGFRDFTFHSTYSHGEELSTGTMRFIAMHTPGHLNDHYCLWEPDQRIFIGFDIDLSPFGPWYGNLECDIGRFKKSLQKIMHMPAETYLSSHARPLRNQYISKRLMAYASFFEERDRQILGLLSSGRPRGLQELVKQSPFYEADHSRPDKLLWFGEEQMVLKHLEGLTERGLVVKEGDVYRLK